MSRAWVSPSLGVTLAYFSRASVYMAFSRILISAHALQSLALGALVLGSVAVVRHSMRTTGLEQRLEAIQDLIHKMPDMESRQTLTSTVQNPEGIDVVITTPWEEGDTLENGQQYARHAAQIAIVQAGGPPSEGGR